MKKALHLAKPEMRRASSGFICLLLFALLFLPIELWAQAPDADRGGPGTFAWPDGKKAAVCLSYDDGIPSHWEHAIPQLEEFGFRGTFYIKGLNLDPDEVEIWRQAAARGHELGNHSITHPCNGDNFRPEYQANDYTMKRMLDEIAVLNSMLFAIDGREERSYGYPCHIKEIEGQSLPAALEARGEFTGARNGYRKPGWTMAELDLFDIPSMSVKEGVSFEKVEAFLRDALEHGRIAAFCFHGIEEDYLSTSSEMHRAMLAFLQEHEDELWVAPVTEVAAWVRDHR